MANPEFIQTSPLGYSGPETENLIIFLKQNLKKNANETILVDYETGRRWTGEEIARAIEILAKFLIDECNLKKGQLCTIYRADDDLTAILILAVIAVGCVSQVIMPTPGSDLIDMIKFTKPAVIIGDGSDIEEARPKFSQLGSNLADSFKLVVSDEISSTPGSKTLPYLLKKDFSKPAMTFDQLIVNIPINPEQDIAFMQFSSGTTGKPKRIPRTHKNLCHLVASVDHEHLMSMKPGVVIGGCLYLGFRPGTWALLACVKGGSTLVVYNVGEQFEDYLTMTDKYKVTILAISVFFLSKLRDKGIPIRDKYDTSSLKHVITAGSKILDSSLPQSVVDSFKLQSLRQCFGMTESGWVFLIESYLAQENYITVGHVVPGTEAKIVDRNTNKALGPDTRGELLIRGPQVSPGYLTDEEGVLNRDDWTEDGFLKTGDEAYYTSEGLFYIVGRFKELLMFAGRDDRYYPDQIESKFVEHPAVAAVCVVSLGQAKTDYQYDIGRAYVILKPGCPAPTEKELLDFLATKDPHITLDGGVRILVEFPRFPNGKINKQALKRLV